ncbi:MAG: hypothetical protein ACD_45C00436G0001 [uncultured bacterium]|nr:MAG: hypothetical protein ACD_45C00436G0001 [uncultured bacterium]OGT58779.1 MAG: hypothetical protein A3F43_02970 [Gammaproteobacteria bacterium RIFCSPHIGHO2_12_FULL_42_10]
MCMRIFVTAIVLIALTIGVLAVVLPRDMLIRLIMFRDFFDMTLPILAFGALMKYLCTRSGHHHHCKMDEHK